MEILAATQQLTALAHETRLAVFRALVQAGPEGLPAGEIAAMHAVPGPTLSFHLNILSNAGLIAATREGRVIRYAPRFTEMNALLAFLTENCCAGAGKRGACAPVASPRLPPKRSKK
jgi:ArsR family transcriptional regulator, arsenate/arsenite/antimonite-responsive transcriptional repressor